MSRKKKKSTHRREPRDTHRERHQPRLWERIRRILPRLFFAVLLVFLFSHLSALHKLQTVVPDIRMRLNAPLNPSPVAVVRITNEDYRSIFQGRSPLDPGRLEQLIKAIASGKPKIIGVDIDTSAPQFKELHVDEGPLPIIWERDVNEVPNEVGMEPEPLPVLGGKDTNINEYFSGLPLLFDDGEDRVTRRYRRIINTTEGPLPSFTWAIIRNLQTDRTKDLKESGEDLLIRYAGDPKGSHRFIIDASEVLALTKGKPLPDDNPFRNKIVLIGGEYLGQDKHQTPLGLMNGVNILAQVIETELQGGGDRAPNRLSIILMEIFEGILVVLLFHRIHSYGFVRTLALSLLTVFFISVLCSLVAFNSLLRFTYFIPILLCVLIFEFIVEYRSDLVRKIGGGLGRAAHGTD